jgi:hypothetical protein
MVISDFSVLDVSGVNNGGVSWIWIFLAILIFIILVGVLFILFKKYKKVE